MSKVLDCIKAALQIAFSLVVLAIILLNFQDLNLAGQRFLNGVGPVRSIALPGGAGIEFGPAAVESALVGLPDAQKSRAGELIHGLTAKEFVRLMYVGQLKNLCEFENPTPEMRMDVATDYALRDKGLTNIEVNPTTLEKVRVAQGKNPDIGYPRTCYDMTLTDHGYNVKTVLVKSLSEAFNQARKALP
jgi:hypothetical protein